MRDARLRRGDRLESSRDFRRVSEQGRRYASKNFVLLVAAGGPRSATGGSRLGVTVSRRVGGAVVRNRVKRRIREWFRRRSDLLGLGLDIVVIARPSAAALAGREVDEELSGLLGPSRARRGVC